MSTHLVRQARKYLLEFDSVDDDLIDRHLHIWKGTKRKTRKAIFRSMIDHAKNRGMMSNVIGDVNDLREILLDFNPTHVVREYSDHSEIIAAIRNSDIRPSANLDGVRGLWTVYAKAVYSCAAFLSAFPKAAAFHEFVESFYKNEHSRLALPLLLAEELNGFGFALACDFLKDNGYEEFVKPDTHLKDICRAAGITSSDSDYVVFKDVVRYCSKHDLVPFEFDKLIWLVGSGKFHLVKLKIATRKSDFIARLL